MKLAILFALALALTSCASHHTRLIRVTDHVQSCIGGTAYYEIELDR